MRQSNLAPAIAKDGTDQVQTHHRRHHGEGGAEKATERGSRKSTPPHAMSKAQKTSVRQSNLAPAIRKKAPIKCNASWAASRGRGVLRQPPRKEVGQARHRTSVEAQKRRCVQLNLAPAIEKKAPIKCNASQAASRVRGKVL